MNSKTKMQARNRQMKENSQHTKLTGNMPDISEERATDIMTSISKERSCVCVCVCARARVRVCVSSRYLSASRLRGSAPVRTWPLRASYAGGVKHLCVAWHGTRRLYVACVGSMRHV